MKYAFKKIAITAPFATLQCGFSSQTELINEVHDPLYCRIFSFINDDTCIIHYSFDLLAFDLKWRDYLENTLSLKLSKKINVITSSTHTHFSHNIRDEKYLNYLINLLINETTNLEYEDIDNITVSSQYVYTKAIGKSRISNYESNNEILSLIRFYKKNSNFFTIVIYNCHPTILDGNTPYFTSEYPGYVLSILEKLYPKCNFTFMQGACGDISSRFTRTNQTYAAVKELGDKLVEQIQILLNQNVSKSKLFISLKNTFIDLEHEFTDINLKDIPNDISDREKDTIKQGIKEREKLLNGNNMIFGKLASKAMISCLNLGVIKIIFFPNEIFSSYLDYLNPKDKILVSYSNGYGPYVLPIDFKHITYEMFVDTLSNKTKEEIINTFKTI